MDKYQIHTYCNIKTNDFIYIFIFTFITRPLSPEYKDLQSKDKHVKNEARFCLLYILSQEINDEFEYTYIYITFLKQKKCTKLEIFIQ